MQDKNKDKEKEETNEASEIWTERYRPSDFDEVVGQQEIVKRVSAFVSSRNLPHLLFAGPAGTGKSSLALIIVKKLFRDTWRSNYLELNASDERGIDVIRQKVKDFARTKSLGEVPFKIIFLDEADALTREAQQALRRTMENFASTCRFILSCNHSGKIIEPIQSRCALFRFSLLSKQDIESIIERIAKKEGLKIDKEAIDSLYEISEGDCRRAINILQSSASSSKHISSELLYRVVTAAKPQDIKTILRYSLEGKFQEARQLLLDVMLRQSVSGLDIIKEIQKEIWNLDISNELKVRLIERTGEAEFRLTEGSDELIQLEALLASFFLAGKR